MNNTNTINLNKTKKKYFKFPKPKRSHYILVCFYAIVINSFLNYFIMTDELINEEIKYMFLHILTMVFSFLNIFAFSYCIINKIHKYYDNDIVYKEYYWIYCFIIYFGIVDVVSIIANIIKLLI